MSGTVPVTWMRGVFGGELGDFRRRRAADDGEGGLRAVLADQGKDFADEIEHAIHVGEPVHGADEDEIRGGGRGRSGGQEVIDVDAGGDLGDAGDVKEAAHLVGIGLGNRDDVAGCAADAALVVVHAIGLEVEVGAAQGVWRVLHMAAPDHGFDVVLEKDGVGQVGKVAGGGEVIDNRAIEAFLADEIFEEVAHAGRVEAFDGNRCGREESANQFGIERGTGLRGNAVWERIGLVRILVGACGALGLGWVVDSHVMDFMPAVEMA